MSAGEAEQTQKRFKAHLGLIAQRDDPVGQTVLPIPPAGGALNGTEHVRIRARIADSVLRREPKAIPLPVNFRRDQSRYDGDLSGASLLPLLEQMSENRAFSPRQQHLWP